MSLVRGHHSELFDVCLSFACQTLLSQHGIQNKRVFPVYLSVHSKTLRRHVCVQMCVTQVAVDMSVPPSPVCHSVEMDVYLGQSGLSSPSFLSLPDSSGPVRDSPSSVRAHAHAHTHTHTHIHTHTHTQENKCKQLLFSCCLIKCSFVFP